MAHRPAGLDPEDPLVRTAVLAHQVEEWMESDVGKFIMLRVRTKITGLEGKLKTIDPLQSMQIAKIQAELSHWEQFAGWLGDAIMAGATAVAIIDGENDAPEDA
jgi:hypothetical protein